jgi:CheY-like chemotaxis protein/nitrogen-specific signal transduction histidine kinase
VSTTHTIDLDALRKVFDHSPFGFALYRADGPCLWANRSVARIVGASLEQVLRQDFRSIESWRRGGLLEAAVAALEHQRIERRQISLTSSFGKQIHLHVEFEPITLLGEPALLLSLSENTDLVAAQLEREAAANALQRSQAEFRAIVERHPDAILVLDHRQRVCFVNPQAGGMLGRAGHQLLGKPLALDSLGPATEDVGITRQDGTRGRAVVRSATTQWKGEPGRLVTLQDITDLRRAEEDLRASERALSDRRSKEAVDRLAGEVAHHLNNQLMVLRGHLELLEESEVGQASPQRFPALYSAIEQLEQLGRGVLGMGRPQPASPGQPAPSEAVQGVAQVLPPSQPTTILLAEDEDELRAMVAESLAARGFHVLQAADGVQALKLAREHEGEIALLVTDVVMPVMGGVELYQVLGQERPETAVLYMSGYTESDHAELYALASQGRYLQKPFSIHYLAVKVEQALSIGC